MDEKIAKITNEISSKMGISHAKEDAQDEKREFNFETIIAAKRLVSAY
jgi:hypothetical protein